MKLYYIANNQLPTTKAHGLQIVKMCEAFTRLGVDCELVVPKRKIDPTIRETDILKYYGTKISFKVTYLQSPSFVFYLFRGNFLNKLLFWFQQILFAKAARKYLEGKTGIVYTRDAFVVYALRKNKLPIYWEIHNLPENLGGYFYKTVLLRVNAIFAISNSLKDKLKDRFKGEVFVAPDGVDLEEFNMNRSRDELRKSLGLPIDRVIALYAGHLYPWKGVNTLISASHMLPDGFIIVCVGGTAGDINAYKKQEKNNPKILFVGHKPHKEVPEYLRAADILLLPNSAKEDISRLYTSPLKMFEYMAANKPIIASDLPSIKEVLNEESAFFFSPDDGAGLANKIVDIYHDPSAEKRANTALTEVKKYTWDERAAGIVYLLR